MVLSTLDIFSQFFMTILFIRYHYPTFPDERQSGNSSIIITMSLVVNSHVILHVTQALYAHYLT